MLSADAPEELAFAAVRLACGQFVRSVRGAGHCVPLLLAKHHSGSSRGVARARLLVPLGGQDAVVQPLGKR